MPWCQYVLALRLLLKFSRVETILEGDFMKPYVVEIAFGLAVLLLCLIARASHQCVSAKTNAYTISAIVIGAPNFNWTSCKILCDDFFYAKIYRGPYRRSMFNFNR